MDLKIWFATIESTKENTDCHCRNCLVTKWFNAYIVHIQVVSRRWFFHARISFDSGCIARVCKSKIGFWEIYKKKHCTYFRIWESETECFSIYAAFELLDDCGYVRRGEHVAQIGNCAQRSPYPLVFRHRVGVNIIVIWLFQTSKTHKISKRRLGIESFRQARPIPHRQ